MESLEQHSIDLLKIITVLCSKLNTLEVSISNDEFDAVCEQPQYQQMHVERLDNGFHVQFGESLIDDMNASKKQTH